MASAHGVAMLIILGAIFAGTIMALMFADIVSDLINLYKEGKR